MCVCLIIFSVCCALYVHNTLLWVDRCERKEQMFSKTWQSCSLLNKSSHTYWHACFLSFAPFNAVLHLVVLTSLQVLKESGPPHMKSFLTRVTVGEFSAEGEGNSKKLSKKRAALSILQELKKLPFIPTVEKPKTHYKKRTKTILKVLQFCLGKSLKDDTFCKIYFKSITLLYFFFLFFILKIKYKTFYLDFSLFFSMNLVAFFSGCWFYVKI